MAIRRAAGRLSPGGHEVIDRNVVFEFDFEGRYFSAKNLWSEPKPLQLPMPPIMNAGGSGGNCMMT